jgi:diguanylate cyclase (GGDEF)-like protein/PAS domain S-box-containing protein
VTAALKQRVLIVDDEPQMLVALEDLLCDDFDVLKTGSAEKALELVNERRDIAVVISDQRMPKMTGDELFTKLDGHSPATRILVTGFADLSAVIRAVNNGKIFAYVTKPWNAQDLRLIVHNGAEYFRLGRELAYERKLLHDLMENVPDGIFFKDLDLQFVRTNRALGAMLGGVPAEELTGRRLSEVVSDDRSAASTEGTERTLLQEGAASLDVVRKYSLEGRPRWVSESKAPIRSPEGHTIGLVGIARDVTERVQMDEALRTSEERLRLVFRGSAAGLFDWNILDDRITYSPSFGHLFGHEDGEWRASVRELVELVHPDDIPRLKDALQRHFETQHPFNGLELRAAVRGGEYHWFQASGQAVWDGRGNATRLAGSITDISERKRQEDRIGRLTRIHAVLGGITSAIVRISDKPSLLREACRIAVDVGQFSAAVGVAFDGTRAGRARLVACHASGSADADFLTRMAHGLETAPADEGTILALVSATGRPIIVNDVRADDRSPFASGVAAGPHCALAVFPLTIEGRVDGAFALLSTLPNVFDSEEVKLLEELAANLSFALEHVAQTERLQLLSSYDPLTGLPNRDLLRERIAQTIATCRDSDRKFAVVQFDVDRFRHVNETLGWSAGDELLAHVARRLGQGLPPQHTLARVGANAFAMLLASVDDEANVALLVEKHLQQAVKQSIVVRETELRVSLRTGIALFPADGQDPDALVGNAEAALKGARTSAQRYLFYAPRMNARVAEKLDLETRLRRAIEQREFLLHYQPKVSVKTGLLAGLEALIRWREPSGKLVSPGEFIPVLEDTGLILEVGRWVLETAAAEHVGWVARGLTPPRIAVNVSALQLAQDDFIATLDAVIERFPDAGRGLDLEITESVFVDDLTGNVEKLNEARGRGFQVAIDDFGTGYSSLGYLSRLPIDALKIDRSFVVRMVENPEDTAIVTTLISLAHALELKVIAEGVETTQQAHLLRLLRCDQLQGYLLAKPAPEQEVAKLLGNTTFRF